MFAEISGVPLILARSARTPIDCHWQSKEFDLDVHCFTRNQSDHRSILEARFQADPLLSAFFSGGGMVVSLNNPHEMGEKPAEGLSVWLYRIIRDDQRLNDPPVRLSATELQQPPLPLRLHYLMTPVTSPATGNPETEQLILGKVMQLLYGPRCCAARI